MKVLICDYTGNATQWLEQFAIKKNLEIIGTITPATDKKLLAENSWEYLLVFEQGARQFFALLAQFMNISYERVIYALDWNSWTQHPAATLALINPASAEEVYRRLTFNIARQLNYFMAATTAEGLHYVATSNDNYIIRNTYSTHQNWAADDMKIFHQLAKKYYDIDDGDGYFLDLGANIGTTGIYFTKILAPNLKILAFEPDKENFKLLRANLILNDFENGIAENYGLGDEESEITMYRIPDNPGANRLFKDSWGKTTESVKIISLDNYFSENKLNPKDVKYIWIDTEGFEAKVLLGAKNILKENPAPIFMEFNPYFWQKLGCYEKLMALLTVLYEGFILVKVVTNKKEINVYPIEELWEFQNVKHITAELGDIFLIHKI